MNPAPSLTPAQLQNRLAASPAPTVVDVREFPEFVAGHLPGARLLPLGDLARRAGELPRDREMICVCQSGQRSAQAAAQLQGLGFDPVSQLAGGMIAWKRAGLAVEREARGPWSLERQVRFTAGLLVVLGLALSYLRPEAIVLAWLVPLGLIFAAITDSCAMAMLLAKLPWNRPAPLPEASGEAGA